MRFMKVLDANLDAQILAKKPTKPGGAAPQARGACPRFLLNRHNEQATNHAINARSAPLPRL